MNVAYIRVILLYSAIENYFRKRDGREKQGGEWDSRVERDNVCGGGGNEGINGGY